MNFNFNIKRDFRVFAYYCITIQLRPSKMKYVFLWFCFIFIFFKKKKNVIDFNHTHKTATIINVFLTRMIAYNCQYEHAKKAIIQSWGEDWDRIWRGVFRGSCLEIARMLSKIKIVKKPVVKVVSLVNEGYKSPDPFYFCNPNPPLKSGFPHCLVISWGIGSA